MLIEEATTTRLHRVVDQLLEQHRGAVIVDGDVAVDRIHALADADLGGEVDDLGDALQRAQHRGLVAHVADDHVDLRVEVVGLRLVAVDLLDQAVEHADAMAALQAGPRDVTPDEAGAAGDEDRLCHAVSPGRFDQAASGELDKHGPFRVEI